MKRLIAILLLICTFLPACASKENKKPGPTVDPSSELVSWATHSYDKGRVDQKAPQDASSDYEVYLAKNETEGFGIGLYSDREYKKLTLKMISGNTEVITVNTYEIPEILKLGKKRYTDPAPLLGERKFDVVAGDSHYLLVEFTTKPDTPAGKYNYTFEITEEDGTVLAIHNAVVNVWDFAMPEKLTFETAVGLHAYELTNAYGFSSTVLYKKFYDMLLEHNMSAYNLPYDILDEKANEYMSNPRVTSFIVPYCEGNDAKLLQYYEKLKTNEEWLKKAVFYPLDEPTTITKLNELKTKCERLKRLCPEIRITVPYYKNIQYNNELDQIDFMDQYIDLHCPKLANWDYENLYSSSQMQKYDSFADRMKAIQEKGETIWAYVCNHPDPPYLNVKINDEGLGSRVLFWQFYQRDVQGFLYWCSNRWTDRPWEDVDTFGDGIYGDGILFYPGLIKYGDLLSPISSIRMKIIRDGIDDIELFYLAEELLGYAWIMERVNKASKKLTSVNVSSDEFAALRTEIGNAVEAALKKA